MGNNYDNELVNKWIRAFNSKADDLFGANFQYFFNEIMKLRYKDNFDAPKSFGGDDGCDGYFRCEGNYFAVNSPENLKWNIVKSKFQSDINNLLTKNNKWPYEIKNITFVLNIKSKDKSFPANFLQLRDQIEKNKNFKINLWTQENLKSIFLELKDEDKIRVLKNFYVPLDEIILDGHYISKILEKLINEDSCEQELKEITKFNDKIILNNLDLKRSSELTLGSYHIVSLNKFISEWDFTTLTKLSEEVKKLYEESTKIFSDSNLQFDFIKNKIWIIDENESIPKKKAINSTKLIIMAKFFENCTIFKSKKN